MRKVCFIIVNRSNFARVKDLMVDINKDKSLKLQTIACSSSILSKYGSVNKDMKKAGIKIDYEVYSTVSGQNLNSMSKSTGMLLLELSTIFNKLKPDIIITIGDRFETIATAITASYQNIFLCHIQGGELTGSIDERVRHAVTKLSNLHFVCTERSKKILIQMGEKKDRVFNVGCSSIDLIKKINLKKKVNLKKYNFGVGSKTDLKKPYIVVLIHPDTIYYDQNKMLAKEICSALKKINSQVIWIWPNIDAGSDLISQYLSEFRDKNKHLKFNFYKHFKQEDYLRLISNSLLLVGNSSSGIREATYLGIPVVNIGTRQNMRERGKNVLDTKAKASEIYLAIKKQIKIKKYKKNTLYGKGESSKQILKILKNTKLNLEKRFQIKS